MIAAIVASTTALGFGFGVAAMALSPHAPEIRTIGVPYPIMPGATTAPAVVDEPADDAPDTADVTPRASAPTLDPACVLPSGDAAAPASCQWDDGFPAIANDGATVAVKSSPSDGGRGYPNLSINFLDARTGKLLRSVTVVDANEYDEAPEARAKLQPKIAQRAAVAQKLLDAGRYRPLTFLGATKDDTTAPTDPTVRTEIDGDAIRIFDVTGTPERVLWQHHFAPDHTPSSNPDGECTGFDLQGQSIYWDATTKTVLAHQRYFTGGCMCADYDYDLVARIP